MNTPNTRRTMTGAATDASTGVLLAAMVVFALLVSTLVLSRQSLRLDEAQSLWQTSHSWNRMIAIVAGDVHVPLYHTLLHFWQVFFGNGVRTGRLLSLFFFVLTIPAVYFLGMAAYARRSIALFAAFLVACSPFLNWYGSEIRMYSLLVLLTVVNQYCFVRLALNRPVASNTLWWAYGITALLGVFTHYFFVFGLVAQAVFYLANRQLFPGRAFGRFVLIAGIIALALALWLAFVLSTGGIAASEPHLTRPTTINLFNTFSQFLFGFQDDHINTLIVSLWPVAVLFAFFILSNDRRLAPPTAYFFLTATLPVVLLFFVSIAVKPIYLTRYLILTVPSLYLFLSWAFSTCAPSLARALRIFLIIGLALTFVRQTVSADTPVKESYRQASEYLNARAQPQDIVVVSAPFTIYPVEYYYTGSAAMTTLPIWDRDKPGAIPDFSEERLPGEVADISNNHDRVWLLLSYDQGYERAIKLYFDTHFERLEDHTLSPGMTLAAYQLRYGDQTQSGAATSTRNLTK